MKKFKKALLSLTACVLSAMLLFAFTGCTDKEPQEEEPAEAKITGITMDPTTAEIDTGDTVDLKVTASYDDGTSKRVYARDGLTYESSATTVASVNSSGQVEGKASGTATITAKIETYTATCTVNVHTLTLELSDSELTIEKNYTEQLTATVKRDGTVLTGDDAKVEWTTSDRSVATVSENGLVTAVDEGNATITATKGGLSETCDVTVVWKEKPAGYNPVQWAEQNKINPNTWGYWNAKDLSWGAGGLADDNGVYTDTTFVESSSNLKDGYEYIGMGRVTFEYTITQHGLNYVYQAFYRSSDNVEGGKLHYNHDYELTFKLLSNVSGEIHVNPYDDVRAQEAEESEDDYKAYLATREATGKVNTNHDFEIAAGVEQTITVIFRHDDCGYIYAEGIYDNMGSALHLQLGDLYDEENGGKTILSVWDFQYKDLGEADNKVECDETKHAGYVDPDAPDPSEIPTHPTAPEVKNVAASTAEKVYLTVEDEKAVFNLEGTLDLSYFNNSKEEAQTWLLATRFDLARCGGDWASFAFNRISATVDEDGSFHIKYDITYLSVDTSGTGAYNAHFTEKESSEAGYNDNHYRDVKLDAEHAVPGETITVGNKKYTIVNVVGGSDQASNWGCVSIKVEKVEG